MLPQEAAVFGTAVMKSNLSNGKSMMVEAQFGDMFRAELRELLSWRRDVRHFKRDVLPDGTFERLVEIACLRPVRRPESALAFVAVRASLAGTPFAPALKTATPRRCDPRGPKERGFTRG